MAGLETGFGSEKEDFLRRVDALMDLELHIRDTSGTDIELVNSLQGVADLYTEELEGSVLSMREIALDFVALSNAKLRHKVGDTTVEEPVDFTHIDDSGLFRANLTGFALEHDVFRADNMTLFNSARVVTQLTTFLGGSSITNHPAQPAEVTLPLAASKSIHFLE